MHSQVERRGMTVTELLVTLLIVGFLGALLFPVFARTREQARLGVCISNQRQIYAALKMYEADSGRLPVHYGPEDGLRWTSQIAPYVKEPGVYLCPSESTAGRVGLAGEPCSYYYLYSRLHLGAGGVYREPAPRSPLLDCLAHPGFQAVVTRNDGSVELAPRGRYAEIRVEFSD
jgi:hypothetical protein